MVVYRIKFHPIQRIPRVSAWSNHQAACRFSRKRSKSSIVVEATKQTWKWQSSGFIKTFRSFSTAQDQEHSVIENQSVANDLEGTHVTITPVTPTTSLSEEEEDNIYKDLQWLSQEIIRHDKLYYSQQPELSDDEFDALVQQEEKLSEHHPHLLTRWQQESGLGIAATRKGRIGSKNSGIDDGDADDERRTEDNDAKSNTDNLQTQGSARLKRKHLVPMLSLDNVHNDEQLWAWLKRISKALNEWDSSTETIKVTIVTEPKLDGVSLSLRYRRQEDSSATPLYKLQWASTRGDGQQGQDVTDAVLVMNQTIPSQITTNHADLPPTIEIRGEVILPNHEFERLPELIPMTHFSNARNAASGILLRKDTDVETDQLEAQLLRSKLRFFAYEMVADPKQNPMAMDGHTAQEIMADMGFSIPSPIATTELELERGNQDEVEQWSHATIAPMLAYYQALQLHRDEKKTTKGYDWGDYEMDGCVHKVSQNEIRGLLGRSTKSPKWAVAHKFPPRAVVTKLVDITVQVGRTGALTPVAILEPIDVGGVTIQRATLHNFGHLQQVLGGKETAKGTLVLVRRAGDVIPQVVQRVGTSDHHRFTTEPMISLETPSQCPACSSPVIQEDVSSTGIGQVLRCGGPPLLCPPRAVTSLAHAFSRDAMDVIGLSEGRIQQLLDAGLIRFPSDIFEFDEEKWKTLQDLPGWGPKSCQNLRSSSQRVATVGISLSRFIYSLGVRHLGKHSSELVASCYGTKDAFLTALDTAAEWTEPESTSCNDDTKHPFVALQGQLGIGPVLIQSLLSFSKEKELVDAAKRLANVVLVLEEQMLVAAGKEKGKDRNANKDNGSGNQLPWKGYRVVFTGSIPGFSRSEAQKTAKLLGAKATPASVSKSTDLVVVGEKGGKKGEQADALGIPVMTAQEFTSLVEETSQTKD